MRVYTFELYMKPGKFFTMKVNATSLDRAMVLLSNDGYSNATGYSIHLVQTPNAD